VHDELLPCWADLDGRREQHPRRPGRRGGQWEQAGHPADDGGIGLGEEVEDVGQAPLRLAAERVGGQESGQGGQGPRIAAEDLADVFGGEVAPVPVGVGHPLFRGDQFHRGSLRAPSRSEYLTASGQEPVPSTVEFSDSGAVFPERHPGRRFAT
jgi:hypothetical protein